MSFLHGMAAINLEMSDKVPRTEYSVLQHWKLINHMFGTNITPDSPLEIRQDGSKKLLKEWDFDFIWNVLFHRDVFDGFGTSMGHASYAAGGVDFRDDASCPFEEPEDVLDFDPFKQWGTRDKKVLVDKLNANFYAKKEMYDDAVNMTGIYVSCMSGLIDLFGWDMLLMAAGIDYDGFGDVTNRYSEWIKQYFEAIAACDSPVVMVHDDIVWTSGAFIKPEWYRKYIFPNYVKLFQPLKEAGKKIMYTSDGNFTEFIDDIAATGVNGFVMEPMTDMQYIADKYGKTHTFVGNADTRVLLSGTKDDIYNEVKRCMDIGKKHPGFIMAVGNHIPANTPIDNALWYNEAYEKMSKR